MDIMVHSNSLEEIFNSYTDRIIRLDSTFRSNQLPIFKQEKLYYNTFFIINDRIIPASTLVQCIIDSMDQQRDNHLIRFLLNKISNAQPGVNTFESIIMEDPDARKKRYSGSALNVANLIKISYKIQFNFDRILDMAYGKASSQGISR